MVKNPSVGAGYATMGRTCGYAILPFQIRTGGEYAGGSECLVGDDGSKKQFSNLHQSLEGFATSGQVSAPTVEAIQFGPTVLQGRRRSGVKKGKCNVEP